MNIFKINYVYSILNIPIVIIGLIIISVLYYIEPYIIDRIKYKLHQLKYSKRIEKYSLGIAVILFIILIAIELVILYYMLVITSVIFFHEFTNDVLKKINIEIFFIIWLPSAMIITFLIYKLIDIKTYIFHEAANKLIFKWVNIFSYIGSSILVLLSIYSSFLNDADPQYSIDLWILTFVGIVITFINNHFLNELTSRVNDYRFNELSERIKKLECNSNSEINSKIPKK